MAELLAQAFQAYDGTIFDNEENCKAYEATMFSREAPMLAINPIDNSLYATRDYLNVNYVLFNNLASIKQFIELRTNAMRLSQVDLNNIEVTTNSDENENDNNNTEIIDNNLEPVIDPADNSENTDENESTSEDEDINESTNEDEDENADENTNEDKSTNEDEDENIEYEDEEYPEEEPVSSDEDNQSSSEEEQENTSIDVESEEVLVVDPKVNLQSIDISTQSSYFEYSVTGLSGLNEYSDYAGIYTLMYHKNLSTNTWEWQWEKSND